MHVFRWRKALGTPYFLHGNIADLGGSKHVLQPMFGGERHAGLYQAPVHATARGALVDTAYTGGAATVTPMPMASWNDRLNNADASLMRALGTSAKPIEL